MDALIERLLQYPVEPLAEWQGGVIDCEEMADAASVELPMSRLEVLLWVSSERRVVHGKPSGDAASHKEVISELLEFSELHDFGYRPARICVTDKDLANYLEDQFAGSGTEIIWNTEPEFWCEVKAGFADHLFGMVEAPSLAASDCSEAQIRAFAEAAAAFYRAGPWQYFCDKDLLRIQTPKPPKYLKYATVLGAGRSEFGLGFYDLPGTHWDLHAERLDIRSLELFSLTFNPLTEAMEDDVELWKTHNFPLETGDAFPQFTFFSSKKSRAPKPAELEFVTILLTALAETTEAEIDSGEWTKQVSFGGKVKRCKISLPDLLDPPSNKVWLDRGLIPEQRGNERHFRVVQRVIAQNEDMDLEQLNALLDSQFNGPNADSDFPSESPFDRAENLCYQAIDSHGRRRIQLARQALKEDPAHVEANVLLAESTFDTNQKIDLFRTAVKLGECQHAELLKTAVGQFWGIAETRPLLRAKYGLANALQVDGQANEAIEQLLDILRLNSDDNMGVRNVVVPLLLSQERENEAAAILKRYSEQTGSWLYLNAQVEFLRVGPNNRFAQKAMSDAFAFNPHVVEILMADEPPNLREQYALGSPEEAAIVIQEQISAWTENASFVEWMVTRFNVWKRSTLKRQRDKRRMLLVKQKKSKKSRN